MNREIRLRNRNARHEEIQAEKSVEHEVLDVDCDTDQSDPSLNIFYGSEVSITEQFKSVAVQCELLSSTDNKVEQCDIATNTTLELSTRDFHTSLMSYIPIEVLKIIYTSCLCLIC